MSYIKPSVVLLTSLYCASSFSGAMGTACSPEQPTLPCAKSAWSVDLSALYLRPMEDADWGYSNTIPQGGYTQYLNWNHDYGWGFKLQASYLFSTGEDFTLNWYHVRPVTDGQYASNSNTFHHVLQWDTVNSELGQFVNITTYNKIHYYAGIQYLRLYGSVTNYRAGQFFTGADSVFNGFGPRVGIDLIHKINPEWSVYAKGASAILFGSSKFYDGVYLNYGSHDAVVPEIESKLGINYSCNASYGEISFDGGFMWINTFNGLHNTVGKFSTYGGFESDISFAGPYIGVRYTGSL